MNFEKFYNDNFNRVYKYFYYKSVNQSDIPDLSHDAFFRFYEKYKDSDFDSERLIKIMYGFCSNIYKEWVRQQIKEKRVDFDETLIVVEEEEVENFEDDEYSLNIEKQKEVVKDAINSLNEGVKNVLIERFINGMTRKETAEKLGMSEDTVHKYQKRGVKYLKDILGVENLEGGDVPLTSHI